MLNLTRHSIRDIAFYTSIIGLGLVGVFIIYYTTYWGIGLYGSDSFSYISVARSIANGYGFYFPASDSGYSPLTHFPPMYSLTLALLEIIGWDAIVGARYLNAFLFGFSTFLFGYLIKRTTNSLIFVLFGSILFTFSAIFAELYSLAMSEALFLTLTLLSFILLNEYIFRRKMFLLVITSVILGLAALTRYVGIVNIFTGIVVILLVNKKSSVSRRIISALTLAIISITPILFWTLRNFRLTTTINNRGFEFHPLVLKNYLNAFYTFFKWYLPEKVVLGYEKEIVFVTLGLLVVTLAIAIFTYRNKVLQITRESSTSITQIQTQNLIYLIYTTSYLIAIYISKSFLDSGTGMTNRIFSPLLLISLLLIINLLHNIWISKNRILRALVILISIYLLAFSVNNSLQSLPEIHDNGMGLGRKALHNSQSLQLLNELSRTMPIYNNNPYAVYFYTGRVGFSLNSFSSEANQESEAVIAIFGSTDEYLLQNRFMNKIEILSSDNIASVYLFKP
ncbi:MAG: phospholipid carrier-dependent glycosyltransferase [Anaerolineales bacterium]